MKYKNVTIEKDFRGYYTAIVKTRDRVQGGSYFEPVQADTLQGIKKLITYYTGV